MHHIFKSVYLQQIKVTDSCSAFQNLSKKYIYMSQCEMGVQVNKYPQYNTTRSRLHPERGTIIVAVSKSILILHGVYCNNAILYQLPLLLFIIAHRRTIPGLSPDLDRARISNYIYQKSLPQSTQERTSQWRHRKVCFSTWFFFKASPHALQLKKTMFSKIRSSEILNSRSRFKATL